MKNMILKRLLGLVPLLLAMSFLSFVLIHLSPSDPAEVAIRINAITPTPEVIAQTRTEMGLDKPFLERYLIWIGNAMQGDFGRSYVNGRPVAQEMARALVPTVRLALVAALIMLCLSVSSAIVSFLFEGRWPDIVVRALVFLGTAFPTFWAGLLLIWFFAVHLNLLPTGGLEGAKSYILPALTLSLPFIATYTRLLRGSMLQTAHKPFVLYARACGRKPSAILGHILRNSLQSSLTSLGMSLPKLVAGTFVVESIFAWPGLGRLCVTAIFNRDYPIIQAYILLMGVLFVLFNLLMEILSALVDPRIGRSRQ